MNSKTLLFLISCSLLLGGCAQRTQEPAAALVAHKGPIKVSGAYALYPLISLWITEYQKTHPLVEFELTAKGSGAGLNDLVEGRADLALVSSETRSAFDSLLWMTPVARLGVVLITSSRNPFIDQLKAQGISRSRLAMAFTTKTGTAWGELIKANRSDAVQVCLRTDSSGATDILAKFLWINPADLSGVGVEGEDAMIDAVRNDPLSLGYCNFIYAINLGSGQFTEGIHIIPLDRELPVHAVDSYYGSVQQLQRAMWSGKYPSGLIRNLSIASLGKPLTKETVDFLQWVLQDGQRLVATEGYIEIPSSEMRCRLESLRQLSSADRQ